MRLFVALELDPGARDALARAQEELKRAGADVRWTRAEQWHATLKFFGEVAEERVEEVGAAAARAACAAGPLACRVHGVGTFPGGARPRVVWAGLEEPTGSLARVAAALEREGEGLGFEAERRPFRPHLTLGRVTSPRGADRLAAAVRKLSGFDGGAWTAREIVLFRSELRPEGARYEAVRRLPLGG